MATRYKEKKRSSPCFFPALSCHMSVKRSLLPRSTFPPDPRPAPPPAASSLAGKLAKVETLTTTPQTSLLGYSTSVVAQNSSFNVRMLTKRPMIAALPALSLVPEALAPPNGWWPTTAPVLLQLM